jgi:hypothetical protein
MPQVEIVHVYIIVFFIRIGFLIILIIFFYKKILFVAMHDICFLSIKMSQLYLLIKPPNFSLGFGNLELRLLEIL